MSVEERHAVAYVGGGYSRLSHTLSLSEFLEYGGSICGMPDRSRTHDRDIARSCMPYRSLSYFHRVAATLAGAAAVGAYHPCSCARTLWHCRQCMRRARRGTL